MAYGSPESPEDVEPYYTHIRGGRKPSPEAVQRLRERYEMVGGRTPLLRVTREVAAELERLLNVSPGDSPWKVYVGMKHWHPFISEAAEQIASDGIRELTAVALAPHYSKMSVGGYRKAIDHALAAAASPAKLAFVDSWHLKESFISLIAARITSALEQWPAEQRAGVKVLFSAHSLPARIREWNDPYEEQLLDSCRAISLQAAHENWMFAWQSAGNTGEPWLGPDILDVLESLHTDGVKDVLSVPVGFVCDHLEIEYDIDYEAASKAREFGMTFRRTAMLNADPAFVRVLASIIEEAG